MAFWNRPSQLVERTEAVAQQLRELDPAGPIALALASSTPSAWGGASLALCVPAIARGVKLISGTVAQLPLTQWRDGAVVPEPAAGPA